MSSIRSRRQFVKTSALALGALRTLQANDFRGPIWVKPRQPNWTDMEYHLRNWYYFTWLSGDSMSRRTSEHEELFASIRAGKPLKNGDYMAKSTLLAIMRRMATYTGQTITWD